MPAKTECPRCRTIGFVRSEHIIKGGTSSLEYYCGRCDYHWTESDPGEPADDSTSDWQNRLRSR